VLYRVAQKNILTKIWRKFYHSISFVWGFW